MNSPRHAQSSSRRQVVGVGGALGSSTRQCVFRVSWSLSEDRAGHRWVCPTPSMSPIARPLAGCKRAVCESNAASTVFRTSRHCACGFSFTQANMARMHVRGSVAASKRACRCCLCRCAECWVRHLLCRGCGRGSCAGRVRAASHRTSARTPPSAGDPPPVVQEEVRCEALRALRTCCEAHEDRRPPLPPAAASSVGPRSIFVHRAQWLSHR